MKGRDHTPDAQKNESIARSQVRRARAQEVRDLRKKDLDAKDQEAREVAQILGLSFVHVRPQVPDQEWDPINGQDYGRNPLRVSSRGGLTIAYALRNSGKQLEIALGKCSRLDTFCKVEGRYQAATAFDQGLTLSIPLARKIELKSYLYGMFLSSVQPGFKVVLR
jgi:hypothetical protein